MLGALIDAKAGQEGDNIAILKARDYLEQQVRIYEACNLYYMSYNLHYQKPILTKNNDRHTQQPTHIQ